MDASKTFKTRFNDKLISCTPIKPGQMIVISMVAKDGAKLKDIHRIFRIIESCIGPEEWDQVEDGMAAGTIDVPMLLALFGKLAEGTRKVNAAAEDAEAVETLPDTFKAPAE